MPELVFLTVKEVAEILRINVIGAYDLINKGELKAHRFSERRTRISESDLNDYVEKRKISIKKQLIKRNKSSEFCDCT